MDLKDHKESSEQLELHNEESDMQYDALPPTHTMGRPPGYDPNRIPASIFASKPSTPMEWSVASNESLFSINVGNSSFSRDQYSMMVNRFEEFSRPDEPYQSSIGLPTVSKSGDSEIKTDSKEVLEKSAESTKVISVGPAVDSSKDRMPPADDAKNYVSSPVVAHKPAIDNSKDMMLRAEDASNYADSPVVGCGPSIDNSKERMPPADDAPNNFSSPLADQRLANNNSKDRMPPAGDASNYASSPVLAHMSTCPSEDHRTSDGSIISTQSFAFPTFGGDAGRSSSVKMDSAKQTSMRNIQLDSQTQPQSQLQTQSRKQSQPRVFKGFPRPSKNSWFSCFSCCGLCNRE